MSELFSFTATFLWDILVLSAEILIEVKAAQTLRDKLQKIFDMWKRVIKFRQQLSGEKIQNDEALIQPYTAQIRETFEMGAGGGPDLPSELRSSSANLDKTSIVLNILGIGLAVVRQEDLVVTAIESLRRPMVPSLAANNPTVLCTIGK